MTQFDDDSERRPEKPHTPRSDLDREANASTGSRREASDYDTASSEYEGGYGGGRQRGEEWPEHGFGERGWGGGRGTGPEEQQEERKDLPEGAHPVADGPAWQERYARENADKYGQSGGQPIEQRGPAQSEGGYEKSEGLGSTQDLSSRGGMGLRETETIETGTADQAEAPSKTYDRSDDEIREEVNRKLTEHPHLDATEIQVEVTNGAVTLSGRVDDRAFRDLAEDIAHQVSGAREVHNRIRLMSRQSGEAAPRS